jgi:small-conductance mechanosensitive channel
MVKAFPRVALGTLATVAGMPPAILATVTAAESDACGDGASAACLQVYRWTHNDVLARAADWLIARPFKILLIVALAVAASYVLRRVIDKFVAGVERATHVARREPGGANDVASLFAAAPLGERAHQRAETLAAVLRSLGRAVIWTIAGLTILGEFEINLGPLLAGAGIVGIALGFGAQTLVKDFLSGIFMLIEDQFGVGDVVDAGFASGTVEGVSLRTTRIRDVEGTVWHIPNGEIHRIANKSQDWARAVLDLPVAVGTDVHRAREVIKDVADAVWRDERWTSSILEEPEVWGVEGLARIGITIRLVVKTRPADQWDVLRVLRERIASAFVAEGIDLPPPDFPSPPVAH